MPPKLSKAERDKLRREEAERKAREEEEQRRQEEEEQREKEEQEKREQEERDRQQALQGARFLEETARLNSLLAGRREALEEWKKEELKKKQWSQYLSCGSLPDPTDQRALNSYLSLCQDDTSDPSIEHSLESIKDCLDLSGEVEKMLYGDGFPKPTEQEAERYQEVLSQIRSLTKARLDQSTCHYLENAEKHVDSETYNLRVEAKTPELTYCLWGNVVKNPRLKDFSFKEFQFTLGLPKPLLLVDVGIRVLRLPSDPLSPLCRTYHCSKTTPTPGEATPSSTSRSIGDAPGDQEDDETASVATGGGGDSAGAGVREGSATSKTKLSEAPEGGLGSGVELPPAEGEGQGGGAQGEGEEQKDSTGDVPPSTAGNGDGDSVKVDEGGGGDGLMAEDEIDLRAFRLAGGPILLELLEMPPQPKVANNWTIKKVISRELKSCPYPAEVARAPPPSSGDQQPSAPPAILPGSNMWPAVGITMQLPEHFLFPEQPQLARWDGELRAWRTNGLQDVLFDLREEERTVTFQTFYFSPLAVMVDQYANMPFESWQLRPLGPNHTHLTITGGILEITVEIKEYTCTLLAPSEQPALSHLSGRAMTARKLMEGLERAGANFFPAPDGDKYVSITAKSPTVEPSLYQHMALLCCAFAFQWSKWNSEAGRSKFVVLGCEAIKGELTEKLSWSTYVGGRKSCRLKIDEDSDKFSMDRPEGSELHPDLFSTLDSEASPQARERVKSTSPVHTETVQQWLTATKVLTYS